MKLKVFGIFLLVILAAFPHISIPQVKGDFTGADGEYGNWTWDGYSMVIVANATANAGNSEANAYSCMDIVNAINYYGWSAQYNVSFQETQFAFISIQFYISNGTTPTWFADESVQIYMSSSTFWTNANGHLRFGRLLDYKDKITTKGVSLLATMDMLDTVSDTNSSLELYSVHGDYFGNGTDVGIFCGGNTTIVNSMFTNMYLWQYSGSLYLHNVWFFDTSSHVALQVGAITEAEEVHFIKCAQELVYLEWDFPLTLKNFYGRNCSTNTFWIDASGGVGSHHIIDGDFDSWTFSVHGENNWIVYREYTFDLTVAYSNETVYQNANVTLSYYGQGGGTVGSWLTDANGEIPTQTLTMGFYNKTSGNALYNYNPYNLKITTPDMQTKDVNFTLTDKTEWNLPLTFNTAPTARFAAPLSVTTGENFTLDATDSIDTDSTIASYFWDFDDGTNASTASVTHSYTSAGTYHVNLTVTDIQGATDSFGCNVTARDPVSSRGSTSIIYQFPDVYFEMKYHYGDNDVFQMMSNNRQSYIEVFAINNKPTVISFTIVSSVYLNGEKQDSSSVTIDVSEKTNATFAIGITVPYASSIFDSASPKAYTIKNEIKYTEQGSQADSKSYIQTATFGLEIGLFTQILRISVFLTTLLAIFLITGYVIYRGFKHLNKGGRKPQEVVA